MPLSDRQLWQYARHVIAGFGDKASDHAFDRIVESAKTGDEEGVATWQAIAERIEQLLVAPPMTSRPH